jgi:membrane associated rhomboid family serine protease
MVLVDANGREISDDELDRLVARAEADGKDEDEFWDDLHLVPSRSEGTLLLQYGAGLKPWQWMTSIFMHAGIGHLLGNMIFLWAFGLIVEGKIGWLPFTLLYLAIGCGQSALE